MTEDKTDIILTVNGVQNSNQIEVSAGHGFTVGDTILIRICRTGICRTSIKYYNDNKEIK